MIKTRNTNGKRENVIFTEKFTERNKQKHKKFLLLHYLETKMDLRFKYNENV